MPTTTTRKLRSSATAAPSFTYTEDDEDEFGSAQPFFLSDLYTPDETTSNKPATGATATRTKKASVKKKVSESVFECDWNLPVEGIELEAKLFLLNKLDMKGGPTRASTYKNRYLSRICRENPLILGCIGSQRRVRTKWLVDRWKRDTKFDEETRSNLMRLAQTSVLQTLPSTTAPPAAKAEPLPKPLSPPKVINQSKKSSNMFSPNRKKGKLFLARQHSSWCKQPLN